MGLDGPRKRLSIYLGESDRYGHRSLAQALVERARAEGLAGATVLRGIEGYGAANRLHTNRILTLSEDLPMMIEIVDRQDRVEAFLPIVDQMVSGGCLITIEDVVVHLYRGRVGPRRGRESQDPPAPPHPDPRP